MIGNVKKYKRIRTIIYRNTFLYKSIYFFFAIAFFTENTDKNTSCLWQQVWARPCWTSYRMRLHSASIFLRYSTCSSFFNWRGEAARRDVIL